MTTFQSDKRPFVAVDVANIRESRPGRDQYISDDHPLFIPGKEFQHFSLDVVEQFMKDLEALLPESIILYFIDHAVKPTSQDPEELKKFLTLTQFDGEKPPRIVTVKPRDLLKRKIRADDVLCELHNKCKAVLISIDYFKDEIKSGKIQDLHNLVQFYPVPHWGSQPVFEFEHRRETYGHRTLEELVEKNNSEASRQEALDHVSKFLTKQKPPKKKKERITPKPIITKKRAGTGVILDRDDFEKQREIFIKNNPPPASKPQNLLFVFSISKRKKFVGKKVTLIGRLIDKREPETPIIWFGSTTPVFITVSDIGGLKPGFVQIVGQLCMREDGTWSIENVEYTKNIDGLKLKTTTGRLSQSPAKNTLKPWGVPPWNRLKLDPDGPRREAELKKLRAEQNEKLRREHEEAKAAEDEQQQRERKAEAARNEKTSRAKDQSLGESAQEIEDQGIILSQRIRVAQIGLLITGLTVLAIALFRIFVG